MSKSKISIPATTAKLSNMVVLVLVALKLLSVIDWGWWAVLTVPWSPMIVFLLFAGVLFTVLDFIKWLKNV